MSAVHENNNNNDNSNNNSNNNNNNNNNNALQHLFFVLALERARYNVYICAPTRKGDTSVVHQACSESSPVLLQFVIVPVLSAKPRGVHGIDGKIELIVNIFSNYKWHFKSNRRCTWLWLH